MPIPETTKPPEVGGSYTKSRFQPLRMSLKDREPASLPEPLGEEFAQDVIQIIRIFGTVFAILFFTEWMCSLVESLRSLHLFT